MPSKCVLGCYTISDVAIHTFPNPNKDPKRFNQWVDIVGGLQGETHWEFYKRRKICDIHFTEECRNRHNRLNAIAVPTLFLKGNAQNLNDYRIKRSNKHEIRMEEEYLDYDLLEEIDKTYRQSNLDKSADLSSIFEDQVYTENACKDENNKVHVGFRCNICGNQIIGFRYVCVQCVDWDMCSGCEARAAHSHHYVLRLPGPRPYAEIQNVLECIRHELREPRESISDCTILKQEDEIDTDYSQQNISTEYLELSDKNDHISPHKVKIPKLKVITKTKKHTFNKDRRIPKIKVKTPSKTYAGHSDKGKQLLRLKMPSEIILESFQQSLNKQLVVKLKRLSPSLDHHLSKPTVLHEDLNFQT